MRGRRLRWLASASLLFHGSLRGSGPQESPIAVPGKAADLPGAGRTVVAHIPIISLTGGATIPTISFYPLAAVMSGLAPTEHTTRAGELQPCFARRIFLKSEENDNADSAITVHSISVHNPLFGSVRAGRGQQCPGNSRCGWQGRLLPGGFHCERRSRQANL